MDGFYLLCGHLLGDYILQNDWQAQNKANPHPKGQRPCTEWNDGIGGGGVTPGTPEDREAWDAEHHKWLIGELACHAHCALYTLSVWLFTFWWMPLWGLFTCFFCHYMMDRFRLAGRWMRNVSGQASFASGPLAPWSIVVVDNVVHLLTLAAIAAVAGR